MCKDLTRSTILRTESFSHATYHMCGILLMTGPAIAIF